MDVYVFLHLSVCVLIYLSIILKLIQSAINTDVAGSVWVNLCANHFRFSYDRVFAEGFEIKPPRIMKNHYPNRTQVFKLLDGVILTFWVNRVAYIADIVVNIVAWRECGL